MFRNSFLLGCALAFSIGSQAEGIDLCEDYRQNIANFIMPGTWQIDYELGHSLFPENQLPSDDGEARYFDQIRISADSSEDVRNIFKTLEGCAYFLGKLDFPLIDLGDEELENYVAITVEHGNLVMSYADNNQGFKQKRISIVPGSIRASDKLFIESATGMTVWKRM